MEQVARDTGGKAIYNTNDLKGALADVIKNGDHYYTLAYDPKGVKQDGKFHKIEVKFNQPEYKLLYRHGYVAADAECIGQGETAGQAGEQPGRLVCFGRRWSRAHHLRRSCSFRVQVLAEEKQPAATDAPKGDNAKVLKPVTRYVFGYAVGDNSAQLVQAEDGNRHGMLLSMVIVYDKQGRPLNSVLNTQTLSLDPKVYADSLKTGLPFYQELDIPQQDVTVRVGVYDVGSGAMGAMEFPLNVKQVLRDRRRLEAVDVFGVEDRAWVALPGDDEHRVTELLGGGDVLRQAAFEQGHQRGEEVVEKLVEARLGADAVKRLDEAGAEHVSRLEGQAEQVVFGAAFDACPHEAALFGGIGASAGDVNEGHAGVEAASVRAKERVRS